jgi:hypothetical protein
MHMRKKSIQAGRRRFLKRLGWVTGAGALLALGRRRQAHARGVADPNAGQTRPDRGYRLTAHIRSYYRTAGL